MLTTEEDLPGLFENSRFLVETHRDYKKVHLTFLFFLLFLLFLLFLKRGCSGPRRLPP